ncbi:hypothetical protein [Ectopseudomonas oleovorans]|uniref:Uncharacterized protein n=1 Tax=Ectopseudomonas oleovorans TaxID=301 RepID=A0AA42U0M6_ECTOL|nr:MULTISPECIES: hypothetical protein [Pseudomonas]MDH1341884.1 hypothetical protein [Pseudomonas oleovorans]MDH1490880.1 hypothetical protein [Pseudomonas oleovorans]WFS20609.1 hypothetical protein P9K38_09835 [Pseudomonas sp. 905_Psudmo1]WGG19617.1 hypothetical protein N5O83_14160 [Pseudomonas oleovorans]
MANQMPDQKRVEDESARYLAEMSATQRTRLEHYARSKGITTEQAVTQIVTEFLAAEASH